MTEPRILPGCSVLPPMTPPNGPHRPPPDALISKVNRPKRKAGDRFACLNSFVDFGMVALRPTEQSVWFVLWRDTKPDGTACTSQIGIARRVGLSARTVRRAIDRLWRLGFLRIVRRGGVRQGPSVYIVVPLPAPRSLAVMGDPSSPVIPGHELRSPVAPNPIKDHKAVA